MTDTTSNPLKLQSTYYNIDIYNDNSTNGDINSVFNANFTQPLLIHPANHELSVVRARVPLDSVPYSERDIPYLAWGIKLTNTGGETHIGYVPQFNTQTITTPVYTTYTNSYFTSDALSSFSAGYITNNAWTQSIAPNIIPNALIVCLSDTSIFSLCSTETGHEITQNSRTSAFVDTTVLPASLDYSKIVSMAAYGDIYYLLYVNYSSLDVIGFTIAGGDIPIQTLTIVSIQYEITQTLVNNFMVQVINGVPYFSIALKYVNIGQTSALLNIYSFVDNLIQSSPLASGHIEVADQFAYSHPSIMMVSPTKYYFHYQTGNSGFGSLYQYYYNVSSGTGSIHIYQDQVLNANAIANLDITTDRILIWITDTNNATSVKIFNLDTWNHTNLTSMPIGTYTYPVYSNPYSTIVQTGTTTTIIPSIFYKITTIQQFVNQINLGITNVYNEFTTKPPTCPQIQYNNTNSLFSLVCDSTFSSDLTTPNTIQFNAVLNNQFKFLSVPSTFGYNQLIFINQPQTGNYGQTQGNSSIYKFIDITRIIIQTSKMGIVGDCELSNEVLLSINDFIVNTSQGMPELVIYEPAILRFYQLYQTSPLVSINIFLTYADKQGDIYPILISPFNSIGLKLMFRNSQISTFPA